MEYGGLLRSVKGPQTQLLPDMDVEAQCLSMRAEANRTTATIRRPNLRASRALSVKPAVGVFHCGQLHIVQVS